MSLAVRTADPGTATRAPTRPTSRLPQSLALGAAVIVAAALLVRGAAGAPGSAAFRQQGAKLTGSDEVGNADFGYSVAVSADGTTAIVGGPDDDHDAGAAWVFTRSGSTWREQGVKLTDGASGRATFGWSVALSANGDTAIVGGIGTDDYRGAAWVFTRTGSTWKRQAKLTGTGGSGQPAFGWSVALSASGDAALVGGPDDDRETGAAWRFSRTGTTWKQDGIKRTGEAFADQLGSSVALSGNGNTALLGSDGSSNEVGAAWVGVRSGANWTRHVQKLTGNGETAGYGRFGWTVALSADATTAIVGSYNPYEAAWGFGRTGSTWNHEGGKFAGSGEVGYGGFAASVGLSANGTTAVVGGYHAAWIYTRSGAVWSPRRTKLSGTGQVPGGTFIGGQFGYSVAISGNGDTVLVGAPGDDKARGAVWVFAR